MNVPLGDAWEECGWPITLEQAKEHGHHTTRGPETHLHHSNHSVKKHNVFSYTY